MLVYSQKIVRFIFDIKQLIKEILSLEVGLRVNGERFYDLMQTSTYPIQVVIYNKKNTLGYFDSMFYELGFNESLIYSRRDQLRNLVRHELAHYITFINYGDKVEPHGAEFRAFCLRMGWGEEVYRASACLEMGDNGVQLADDSVLRKVQKLMALSSSSNRHEAEQAMIKSQQLLLKHSIEAKDFGSNAEEKVFLKRIMKKTRKTAKMHSIAAILQTFFITPVFNKMGDFVYLEILGDAVNVEIAEYVAEVLDIELDRLWDQARYSACLKGLTAKNSFFYGLARGYCNKIEALKKEYSSQVMHAVMVIEKKLVNAKALVYERLISSKRSGNFCPKSSLLGEQMGKQLNINPAINQSHNNFIAFIK